MPVYEFYCSDCHTIYNFFSRRINTEAVPACPNPACDNSQLERRMSIFAISRGRQEGEEGDEALFGDMDESKMEQMMASLAGEMEGLDEDDPRQAAKLMRRLYETTGLKLTDGMEEAIRRMEAGEDPEKIEEEMGDVFDEENPFVAAGGKAGLKELRSRVLPPRVDETLYDLA
jgi:putative FmdB family regulatory protein